MGDLVQFLPRARATETPADIVPLCPPITREHHLEAALLIVQSDLETIESALDIEPTSTPTHIPPSVAEALYRALRTIKRVMTP
jgi:hypothetical protein